MREPMTWTDPEYEVTGLTLRQKLALEWIIFKINLKYWLGLL